VPTLEALAVPPHEHERDARLVQPPRDHPAQPAGRAQHPDLVRLVQRQRSPRWAPGLKLFLVSCRYFIAFRTAPR